MILSIRQDRSFPMPLRLLALALVLLATAACHSRGMRPEPRRGMDSLRCSQDSIRMAYVLNRGPGTARLMIRHFSNRNSPIADLALLESGKAGEYQVPDSVMVFSYDGGLATPVPAPHAPAIPPEPGPRPRVQIEYFCR